MNFTNKLILAPMVRIGTLPTRLLALDYGADIVYSEELIDYKLLQCHRVKNDLLGTIDFVWTDGTIIFQTCPQESGRVVLQMGTSDAKRAEKVAKLVERDVAAIDVNMGCPKEFSVKGGMGAALLTQLDKVREILTTLVKAVSIPVTCKIRIPETIEATYELVELIQSTGVAAIGVHGRKKDERPRHDNHDDVIKLVAQHLTIPVIANGGSKEIKVYEDIDKFRENTGAASVMVARAAQWNPSIFRKQGLIALDDVIQAYLKYSVDYDNHEMNVKYCVQQLLHDELDTERGRAMQASATVREICWLWQLDDYYDDVVGRRQKKEIEMRAASGETSAFKRRKLEDGSELCEMNFKFHRKEYPDTTGPKMILYQWTRQKDLPKPSYQTTESNGDRMYNTIVVVENKKYRSTLWDKSKRVAEQAAAAVCLKYMGMSDGRRIFSPPESLVVDNKPHKKKGRHSRKLKSQDSAPMIKSINVIM